MHLRIYPETAGYGCLLCTQSGRCLLYTSPVSYFVASRAKSINELKIKTGKNTPDGVIIYSLYGEKRDRVVLVRQYRYAIGGYIYEFPAGLVEPNEEFHEGAVREDVYKRQE